MAETRQINHLFTRGCDVNVACVSHCAQYIKVLEELVGSCGSLRIRGIYSSPSQIAESPPCIDVLIATSEAASQLDLIWHSSEALKRIPLLAVALFKDENETSIVNFREPLFLREGEFEWKNAASIFVDTIMSKHSSLAAEMEALDSFAKGSFGGQGSRLLSVVGAKGGTGCSLIAFLISLLLRSCKCLLIDMDFRNGTLGNLNDLESCSLSLTEISSLAGQLGRGECTANMSSPSYSIDFIKSTNRFEDRIFLDGDSVKLSVLALAGDYDICILDCSSQINDTTIPVLMSSEKIFLTTVPTVQSLRSAKRILETLNNVVDNNRISAIVNKYCRESVLSKHEIERYLGTSVAAAIPVDQELSFMFDNLLRCDPARIGRKTMDSLSSLLEFLRKDGIFKNIGLDDLKTESRKRVRDSISGGAASVRHL